MNELLAETVGVGVGGETPYRTGNSPTPPPRAHTITCFRGMPPETWSTRRAPGAGALVGAINEAYDLGTGIASQRNIKESAAVVPVPGSAPPSTISSLLNSGTPVPARPRPRLGRAETRWRAGSPGCWPGGVDDFDERPLVAGDRRAQERPISVVREWISGFAPGQ